MKKIIIFISILLSFIALSSAINVFLNWWDILSMVKWNEMASTLNKVDINSNNLKINWKLAVNWKICLDNGQCLGECLGSEHWDSTTNSCINNTQIRTNQACSLKPANSVWNSVSAITQTRTYNTSTKTWWAWWPTLTSSHNLTASTTSCNFVCDTSGGLNWSYYWNWSSCVQLWWANNYRLTWKTSTTLSFAWNETLGASNYIIKNYTDSWGRKATSNRTYTFTWLTPWKRYVIHMLPKIVYNWQDMNGQPYWNLAARTDCPAGQALVWDICITPSLTKETALQSCAKIKELNTSAATWTYWIDPDWWDKSNAFQAHCNMDYNWGGRTLVWQRKTSASTSELSTAWTYWNFSWTNTYKISDSDINRLMQASSLVNPLRWSFDSDSKPSCTKHNVYWRKSCNIDSTTRLPTSSHPCTEATESETSTSYWTYGLTHHYIPDYIWNFVNTWKPWCAYSHITIWFWNNPNNAAWNTAYAQEYPWNCISWASVQCESDPGIHRFWVK